MLKKLVKIKLLSLVSSLGRNFGGKSGKRIPSVIKYVLMAALYLYVMIVFGLLFGFIFSSLAVFEEIGLGWLYFAVYAILAIVLMAVGSTAAAKAQIFDAKDNDLLLSMPIRPWEIIVSRLLLLIVINFVYMLVVLVPAAAVWAMDIGFTVMSGIAFIVISAALILFSTALGMLLGWFIALISRKTAKKTLVSTVFTLAFLAVYFYIYTSAQRYLALFIENSEEIAASMRAFLPLYWLSNAISEGNILYLLLSAVILVLPFALAVWIISKTFNKIIADSKATVRIKEKKTDYNIVSPQKALLRREVARLFSSSVYLINSGLGVVMGIVAAVVLVIKKEYVLQLMSSIEDMDSDFMAAMILIGGAYLMSMVMFTAPSVSLEGKTLWILKSLPVSPKAVLMSKIRLHLMALLPMVILLWLAANICFYIDPVFLIVSLVILLAYALLTANIGLIENLRHPKLDWQNEAMAVKSSMSVGLTVFINLGIAIASMIAVMAFGGINFRLTIGALLVVISALALLTYRWIITKGVRRFEELN